jgi:hypothetical protein
MLSSLTDEHPVTTATRHRERLSASWQNLSSSRVLLRLSLSLARTIYSRSRDVNRPAREVSLFTPKNVHVMPSPRLPGAVVTARSGLDAALDFALGQLGEELFESRLCGR